MELLSPSGSVLYKEAKQQYDSYTWTTDTRGEYKFCFSNEFSTFTHKRVYFSLQVGDEKQVDKVLEIQHVNTMTQVKCIDADSKWNKLMLGWTVTECLVLLSFKQLETSAVNMHDSLKTIADYQTHQRLRETQGRIFAEAISERVQWWSLGQSMVIVAVGVGQVVVLRSFFPDRKRWGDDKLVGLVTIVSAAEQFFCLILMSLMI